MKAKYSMHAMHTELIQSVV